MIEPNETTSLIQEEPINLVRPRSSTHGFVELISIPAVQQVLISTFRMSLLPLQKSCISSSANVPVKVLVLTAMSFDAGFVLFAYSSVDLGGISLSPTSIALCLSVKGALSIGFSLLLFPLAQRKIGIRPLYRAFAACWVVVYALPPVMNLVISGSGDERWVKDGSLQGLWLFMIPLILLYVFGDLVFP